MDVMKKIIYDEIVNVCYVECAGECQPEHCNTVKAIVDKLKLQEATEALEEQEKQKTKTKARTKKTKKTKKIKKKRKMIKMIRMIIKVYYQNQQLKEDVNNVQCVTK